MYETRICSLLVFLLFLMILDLKSYFLLTTKNFTDFQFVTTIDKQMLGLMGSVFLTLIGYNRQTNKHGRIQEFVLGGILTFFLSR